MKKDGRSDKEVLFAVAQELGMPPAKPAISGKPQAAPFNVRIMADLIGTSYPTVWRVVKSGTGKLTLTMRKFAMVLIILKHVRDDTVTDEDRKVPAELLAPLDDPVKEEP